MTLRSALAPSVLALALLAGCPEDPAPTASDATAADATADAAPDGGSDTTVVVDDPDCDPLVPSFCALPWPSSHYLADDATTDTGYRIALGLTSLPANRDGVHVSPTRYALADGFSVNAPFIAHFPELDPASLLDENALAQSVQPDSPLLLFQVSADGTTLTQLPIWGEIDPRERDEAKRALFLRPGIILPEATRFIVALRDLKARDGSDLTPSEAFAALRDGTSEGTAVASRQAHFDAIFGLLEGQGVQRSGLLLAWDFVTASSRSMHGDVLKVRDESLAYADANGVPFTITSIEERTVEEDPNIALEVLGTFEVANFQEPYPFLQAEWTRFARGDDDLPVQQGTRQAEFRALIPHSALDGTPHGILMHGHGLNGTHNQIGAGFYKEIANTENFIIVGANMIGMSTDDVDEITVMIFDLSHFHGLAERVQQALVEHLVLIRGMRDHFDQVPEIASRNIVVDTDHLYYSGISQGGIYGASIMALSTDMTRGHLGVPGQNYSLLLLRSVDFDPFLLALNVAYPNSLSKALLLSSIQGIWDSADPVSFYRHISVDPFPNTPSHNVLLASATGDYQVALLSNEITARSDVGVALMPDYGKEVPLVEPTPYPHVGSALVNYSFGNPWPEPGAQPPEDEFGDPHSKPRKLEWHNQQMLHFFRTGEVIDVCGGDGCTPD